MNVEQGHRVDQVKTRDEQWGAGHFDPKLAAGWSDEQLTELSVHVTLNLFTNYLHHFVETDLDLRPRRSSDPPAGTREATRTARAQPSWAASSVRERALRSGAVKYDG